VTPHSASPSYAHAPRPIWPTIVGTLSILQALFWGGVIVVTRVARSTSAGSGPDTGWETARSCFASFGMILPIILVVGGVQLIRRRTSARGWHLAYGVLGLIIYGGMLIVSTVILPSSRFDVLSPGSFAVVLAGVGCIFLAYPFFTLIWFLRPKIRRQMVAWPRTRSPSETLMDVASAYESQECKEPATETEAAPKKEPTFTQAQVADLQKRRELEKRFVNGVRWFYWIAGFSIVNSVVALAGGKWAFLIALGITQFLVGFGQGLSEHLGPGAKYVTFVMAILAALVFVGFGYLARRRYRWALIMGMVLYALDGLLGLAFQDFLGAGFHLLALFGLYGGLKAFSELRKLDAMTEGGVLGPGPAAGSNIPPPAE